MVSHHLNKFDRYGRCGSLNVIILFFHVILEDHVTKEPSNVIGKSRFKLNNYPVKWWS